LVYIEFLDVVRVGVGSHGGGESDGDKVARVRAVTLWLRRTEGSASMLRAHFWSFYQAHAISDRWVNVENGYQVAKRDSAADAQLTNNSGRAARLQLRPCGCPGAKKYNEQEVVVVSLVRGIWSVAIPHPGRGQPESSLFLVSVSSW
jgi:hypothetical protein